MNFATNSPTSRHAPVPRESKGSKGDRDQYKEVEEEEGGVLTVSLNRPESRNAFNEEVIDEKYEEE